MNYTSNYYYGHGNGNHRWLLFALIGVFVIYIMSR